MTRRDLALLALPVVMLLANAVFAWRLAADLRARAGSDSIATLVSAALDQPSKLTPGHVKTVLDAARVIEQAGTHTTIGTADAVAGIGRLCAAIAVIDLLVIAAVARRRG